MVDVINVCYINHSMQDLDKLLDKCIVWRVSTYNNILFI